MFFVQQPALMTLNKLLNYKQKYNIMNKIITLSIATIFLATSYASHSQNIEHQSPHHKTHWGYKGATGPSHWEDMDEKFSMCGKGKMQTPINIVATNDINLTPLNINYTTSSKNVINNGHTVQVNIQSGSTLTIEGETYELKQFHFHTPSENNINGTSYPLETHFVHATKDGKLAVVAVMFKNGRANPILEKIWHKFPLKENKAVSIDLSSADIKSIMPSNKDYYKFMGSLTTPPCSENVKWNVYKTEMTISKKQVKEFYNIFGHTNNRALQNTNNRTITE